MRKGWKEDDLLAHIAKAFRFPGDRRLLLGPGDDCAVLRQTPGARLVITTDELVEGTHYLPSFADPEELARKLLRVNLSDLAGMGAVKPVSCVVAAGLRRDTPPEFLCRFVSRLRAEALRFGVSVAGGNLAGARENHFAMTVWGEARDGGLVRRSGARAGDLLLNVGPLGDAAAGLELLKEGKPAELRRYPGLARAFWRPEPMFAAGAVIAGRGLASALMDNSDGLLRSALALADFAGCRAVLSPGAIAPSRALRAYCAERGRDWRSYALSGGEDYGLVFAARPGRLRLIKKRLPAAAVVGRLEKGDGFKVEDYGGKTGRFEHFQ